MFSFSALFLLFSCFSFIYYVNCEWPPAELTEMLKPIHEYCSKENGVTDDFIKNYVITNTDHNMQCYMACIMRQSNWLTSDGQIKYDFIIDNPWEPIADVVVENVKKCKNIEENEDECITVYNFAKCIHDVDQPRWFVP